MEVVIMYTWELTEALETQYGLLFLCCVLVPIWMGFSAIIPPSGVACFTSAWEVVYGSVRSAGSKTKAYVLYVYHQF